MLTVGRLCVKTRGRDAMMHCVVIEEIDSNYVLVDGNTRRKKVNKTHLEPLSKTLDVKKGADTKTVQKALEEAGIVIREKGAKRTPKAQTKKVDPSTVKKADKKKTDSKK